MRERACSGCSAMLKPPMFTLPLSGTSMPQNIFRVVDLPAPLSPNNPRASPLLSISDNSDTAVLSPSVLCKLFASSNGVVVVVFGTVDDGFLVGVVTEVVRKLKAVSL